MLVLVSGIYCSNTNSDSSRSHAYNKPNTPPVYEFDSSFNGEKAKLINDFFKNRYNSGQFSGAVLFYDSGKYFANSYGYANGKLHTKLSPKMNFQIASVSKTLTAYAVLSLIDQKKLNYNTLVYKILDGFPYMQITVAQLLSHKSGIPNYMYFADKYCKTKYKHLTNKEVLWMLKRYRPKLDFKPESRYKYSNTNYVLLALIVEELSQVPFDRYMKDSVFNVIGMNDSYVFTPKMALNNEDVQGHNGPYSIFPYNYQNGTMGDKGVYTTVFDMLKFDQALRTNLLISPKTLDNACTPHTPCRPTKDYYGYGWRIRYYDNHDTIIYHNGWWQGYKAYFVRWKNKDKCIIVFANTIRGGFIQQTDLMKLMEGIKPKAVTAGKASED